MHPPLPGIGEVMHHAQQLAQGDSYRRLKQETVLGSGVEDCREEDRYKQSLRRLEEGIQMKGLLAWRQLLERRWQSPIIVG